MRPESTFLLGAIPRTNAPSAYIGEAEVIRERLKQHKTKEFWVTAVVFVRKDENLTKAHVRYLESRLLAEAAKVNRFALEQNQAGGSRLPNQTARTWKCFCCAFGNCFLCSVPTFCRR